MWTVVYIAPNKIEAEKIKSLLFREGFLIKLKTLAMEKSAHCGPVEVLVPELEVEEALDILNSYQHKL